MLTSRANQLAVEPPYKHDANGVRDKHYRMAKLRYRLAKFYYYGAVDTADHRTTSSTPLNTSPTSRDTPSVGEEFQGVSETGIPKSH